MPTFIKPSFICIIPFTDEETKAKKSKALPQVTEAREQGTTLAISQRVLTPEPYSHSFNHMASLDFEAGIWGVSVIS